MTQAMVFSHRALDEGQSMPRSPHRFGHWPTEPTTFEADFLLNGVRHNYSFSFTDERVTKEELLVFKSSRPQVWFRRVNDEFEFPGIRFGAFGLRIAQITRPNSLFVSAGELLGHPLLTEVVRWAQQIEFITTDNLYYEPRQPESQIARRIKDEKARQEFISLAKFADLGITDVRPIFKVIERPGGRASEEAHLVFTHHGSQEVEFAFSDESSGTITFFQYADVISRLRESGGILVVDELDQSLHPDLTHELLRLFQDPELNSPATQIIFSTHDISLMDPTLDWPLLRDQVWFTEKSSKGSTTLTPLLDYKASARENIEKMYRLGRFGAIPIIDFTALDGHTALRR